MRTHQRRGYTIVQLVFVLPLIMLLAGLGYQAIARTIAFQGRLHAHTREDARMRSLIRTLEHDASLAVRADVDDAADGGRLVLELADGRVIYQSDDGIVTRTLNTGDDPELLSWVLERSRARFAVESPGPRADLVWITFDPALPKARGPDRPDKLSAAVRVVKGGGR